MVGRDSDSQDQGREDHASREVSGQRASKEDREDSKGSDSVVVRHSKWGDGECQGSATRPCEDMIELVPGGSVERGRV